MAGAEGHFSRYRVQMVDPDQGSSLKVWKEAGSPATPTMQQVHQIIAQSALPAPQERPVTDPIVIPAQGLALVELRK